VPYKSVRDVAWAGRRALVRVDFNVPQDAAGHVTDDTRLRAVLPTLQYLLAEGASLVLMSHLGRPELDDQARFTLRPVSARLAHLLHRPVPLPPALDPPRHHPAHRRPRLLLKPRRPAVGEPRLFGVVAEAARLNCPCRYFPEDDLTGEGDPPGGAAAVCIGDAA